METKLKRIAQISKEQPKTVFTSIYHLINEELLLQCHKELDGSKATGIDRVTKDLIRALNRKLLGHYHYYGVSNNGRMLYNFRQRTIEMLFKVLNKRSNQRSYNWEGLNEMFKVYKIQMPKIYVSLFE